MKPTYKPSQVLRRIRSGEIADPQPKGQGVGVVWCAAKGHRLDWQTVSPSFWENGSYVYCKACGTHALVRVEFKDFFIDVSGERKVYPETLSGREIS